MDEAVDDMLREADVDGETWVGTASRRLAAWCRAS